MTRQRQQSASPTEQQPGGEPEQGYVLEWWTVNQSRELPYVEHWWSIYIRDATWEQLFPHDERVGAAFEHQWLVFKETDESYELQTEHGPEPIRSHYWAFKSRSMQDPREHERHVYATYDEARSVAIDVLQQRQMRLIERLQQMSEALLSAARVHDHECLPFPNRPRSEHR